MRLKPLRSLAQRKRPFSKGFSMLCTLIHTSLCGSAEPRSASGKFKTQNYSWGLRSFKSGTFHHQFFFESSLSLHAGSIPIPCWFMLVQLRHIRLFFEKSADGPGLWIQFPGPLQKKGHGPWPMTATLGPTSRNQTHSCKGTKDKFVTGYHWLYN